ncbi:Myosin-like protein, partial [Globisporangium splendens]
MEVLMDKYGDDSREDKLFLPTDDDQYAYSGGSDTRTSDVSLPTPPRKSSSRLNAEEVFQKNIVGILNKRGYNVRDSILAESSETSTASITSTGSSVSSVLLGLREPVHGQGPLHIAVRKGDCQVLDAVLENGYADEIINVQDNNGNTALHFAAGSWRRPQCMAMMVSLLTAGADVNIKNKRGLTPIAVHMLTLKIDNPTVLLKLLECGADPDTEIEGSSLLHIAARRDFGVISGVLVAFRASLTSLNQDGLMCFEVASKRIKRFMVRSIHSPPIYVPQSQRNKCMLCNQTLLSPKKVVSNFLKRMIGMKVSRHQCNCYHCGLIYCVDCLKRTQVPDMIPFTRSPEDRRDKMKTCRLCESTLLERLQKEKAQRAFDAHLMGFGAAA